MVMARRRVDLRLDEDLFARLDAEAKRLGQTRTKFIERALESALGSGAVDSVVPPGGGQRPAASSRASVKKTVAELMSSPEMGRAVDAAVSSKSYACPKPNCIYVSDKPGVCVHHRTERLR